MKTALALATLLLSSLAHAQAPLAPPPPPPAAYPAPEQPPPPPSEPDRMFSLTWSPVHLVLPLVELTGEFRPMRHWGLAMIAGYGSVTDTMSKVSGRAIEAGGQINYYPFRDFAGLDLGVEALYLTLDDVNVDSSATAAGLAIGPFVGYKAMFPIGLTLVAQLGFEVMAVKGETSTSTAKESGYIPLLNLNAGWSF